MKSIEEINKAIYEDMQKYFKIDDFYETGINISKVEVIIEPNEMPKIIITKLPVSEVFKWFTNSQT